MTIQAVVAALALLCCSGYGAGAQGRKPAAGKTQPAATVYTSFPNAGLKLPRPAGFEKADTFDGFQQKQTGASVLVMRVPGPYAEVFRGFADGEQMKQRGMTLLSRRDITIEGMTGMLVNLDQRAFGDTFTKWIVAFGDAGQTFMVTATLPKSRAAKLSAPLRALILRVRRDATPAPAPGSDLPFTLTFGTKLKPTPTLGKTLTLTKDGVTPAKSPEDPFFLAAPSLGVAPVLDEKEFSLQRLRQIAKVPENGVRRHEPITLDGVKGWESQAEGVEAKTGTPITVYQVMLFGDRGYVLMVGVVGTAQANAYLPEFQAVARSFKRKPRP